MSTLHDVSCQCTLCHVAKLDVVDRPQPRCNGTYVDFQGADRECLRGGEGCMLPKCRGVTPPSGGW